MNPLELIVKTLSSWNETQLTQDLLEAFKKRAEIYQHYDDLAKIAFEIKDYNKAIEYGEELLKFPQTLEQEYTLKQNLVNAYNKQNYPDKALPLIQELKKVIVDDPELIMEESFAYSGLNQKEKCEEILFSILEKENFPEKIKNIAFHNLSGHYFRQDNIKEGLLHYLREEETELEKRYSFKKWDGTITQGKTLIVDTKCGAGDEVIHIRFMKHLKDLGMNPIWTTHRNDLIELFRYNGHKVVHCYEDNDFPEDTEWVYALAIPYYLNLTHKDLWYNHYMKPLPKKEKKYSYLQKDKNFKIGMFWASSSGFDQAHFRNTNLKDYMNVLQKSGHSLYSLQLPDERKEEKEYKQIKSFKNRKDFTDTFSAVNQMDLVITSCTSIAHIAASLGKETCVFVPILDYYIWEHSSKNTYWYGDNVHLFRQTKPRVWNEQMIEFENFMKERGWL
jgi:tetratricopeptide (TPR) repeat protein